MIALALWAMVALFATWISNDENMLVTQLQAAQRAAILQSSSEQTHAVLLATENDRASLDQLISVDVVSVATLLQKAGTASGVAVKIDSATPSMSAETPSGATFQTIDFALEADGSFASLMHALQLFATLPIPSSIGQVDLQVANVLPTASGAPHNGSWHMTVLVHVITNGAPSS